MLTVAMVAVFGGIEMIKRFAKWLGLVLALAVYITGFWLIYGSAPGAIVDGNLNWPGMLIVGVLWSLLTFLLSGAHKEDQPDEESE